MERNDDVLLSVPDAAERLGAASANGRFTHGSLRGKLQRTKIGSRTMIAESELQRFIRDGQRKAEK